MHFNSHSEENTAFLLCCFFLLMRRLSESGARSERGARNAQMKVSDGAGGSGAEGGSK